MINENNFNNEEEDKKELNEAVLDFKNILERNGWNVVECGDNLITAQPKQKELNFCNTFNVKIIPQGCFVDDKLTLRYPVDTGYIVEWFNVNGELIYTYYSDAQDSNRNFTQALRDVLINIKI